MDVSQRIKELRESKRLTQLNVADKLGLEQANYSRIERKGDKLTFKELKEIASAIGVTLKELLFDEGTTKQSEVLEMAYEIAQQKIVFEREKSASLTTGILNHLRNINNYIPSKPVKLDIGEHLQPNDYKVFLTYRGELDGQNYTLAHWEKPIKREESFFINSGSQDDIGKNLLNGIAATRKEREHAQIIQDTANQNIKTDNNLWTVHFINIEEFFKRVFDTI